MADLSIPIFSKCEKCKLPAQNSFCNLPQDALRELDRIKRIRTFVSGERLFEEGKPVHELMIVCEGTATLTFHSSAGNTTMLGLSEPGELLGLSSLMSGHPHETAAEALDNIRVAVIARTDFLRFLQRFPAAAMNAGKELSRKVNRAYGKIRLIGSGLSVRQRLAAWLLQLTDGEPDYDEPITVALTHQQIAQLLGASRESITRALSSLKKYGVIEVRGIRIYVRDFEYLRSLLRIPGQKAAQWRSCDERHRQGALTPLS